VPVSVTLDEAIALRNSAKEAYFRALNSSEYRIGSRQVRHQDVRHLREEYQHWDYYVSYLSGRGSANSTRRAVPFDR
jgi:hypothetical protein